MNTQHTLASLLTALALVACQSEPAPTSQPTEKVVASAPEPLAAAEYDLFGAGVSAGAPIINVAMLAAEPRKYDGQNVRVEGEIVAVCKKKGCWMRIEGGGKKVFVRFRDYGFFMPLDCEGRTAILEGAFRVTETSVADLKHYLEDEGRHEDAAKVTKPKVELTVVADGVALKKRSS